MPRAICGRFSMRPPGWRALLQRGAEGSARCLRSGRPVEPRSRLAGERQSVEPPHERNRYKAHRHDGPGSFEAIRIVRARQAGGIEYGEQAENEEPTQPTAEPAATMKADDHESDAEEKRGTPTGLDGAEVRRRQWMSQDMARGQGDRD